MRKKCNLGWFREFLFTISSLEWILHSLYQGCVFSKIWRELGFVHYIKYFTISRFTISRLGCMWVFFFCKYSKFWSVLQDKKVDLKPLFSEEWCIYLKLECIYNDPYFTEYSQNTYHKLYSFRIWNMIC